MILIGTASCRLAISGDVNFIIKKENIIIDFYVLFNEKSESLFRPPPKTVYHYTGANGLIGLIKEKKVWATHSEYLNDPLEGKFGLKIITSVLHDFIKKEKNNEIKSMLAALHSNFKKRAAEGKVNLYISSFCECENDLVQWKMYGQNGWGYSIGFNVDQSGIDPEKLLPVIYEKNEQRFFVEELISFTINELGKKEIKPGDLSSAYDCLASYLKKMIAIMKQKEYSHEKEWRYVYDFATGSSTPELKFREGKNQTIIPYLSLPISGDSSKENVDAISKIVLGPQREDESESIKTLLRANGVFKEIPVSLSSMRYR